MPGVARVVCFGLAVADRVYRVDALPGGEGKYTASSYSETGGGIAGTAAVAIAAMGGEAAFCGAVGDDAAGQFLAAEMERSGVDLAGLQIRPGQRTPSACVVVDRAGERCLVVDRGTAAAEPPDPALLAGAHAVLIDHRAPSAAMTLLATIPANVPSVLDAEGGDAGDLRQLAAAVSYPIFSRQGLAVIAPGLHPDAALRSLDHPQAAASGVTLGASGSLWLIQGTIHHVPAVPVAVRDTTGCGDVFHGIFALGVAEGMPPLQAACFASFAAAFKARNGEGWQGMPNGQEARAAMTGAGASHGRYYEIDGLPGRSGSRSRVR